MDSVPALEWPVEALAGEEKAVAAPAPAIAVLGVVMTVLGVLRLVGAVAASVDPVRGVARTVGIGSRGWAGVLAADSPLQVVIGAWPLILGVALVRTRWRDLLKAGAMTFLVLSVGGLLGAMADWGRETLGAVVIAIGSFPVPRVEWSRLPTIGRAMAVAGASQLLLEFATAAWALRLATRRGDDAPAAGGDAWRRSRLSRLALGLSAAFLVLTIRLPSGSAYLELINQSRWVREFILRDDLARIRAARRMIQPQAEWADQARNLLDEGERAWAAGRYPVASDRYARVATMLANVPASTMNLGDRRLAAQALNDRAWLMATCPDPALRNYEEAVRTARRALELEPNEYNIWNTLGVAYYRLGNMDDALSALYRSMELHDEGESSDWFFLAMIHHRLGHKERAREWYDMAARHARIHDPGNEDLYRFEVEAAETLGLPRPEKPVVPAGRGMGPRWPGPGPYPVGRGRKDQRGKGGIRAGDIADTPRNRIGRRRPLD